MRYSALKKCILTGFLTGLVLCSGFSGAPAAEDKSSAPVKAYESPEEYDSGASFELEGSYFLGYRFLSQEDSLKAAEYVYPHSSITFGVDLLSAPLPLRYHLNAELFSKYDFYADGGFAYKDMLLFRDILVGIHHNLDHFNFLYPGEQPGLFYYDGNAGDEYYVDYASNLLSLRLKAPNFPFHAFLKHRYVERDGRIEQRFLLGDFNNIIKVSESRDIDWRSNAFTLGANSHLGPIELEYAYDRAEFDPGSANVLYDYYPPSTNFSQPGDVYPHNVVPETESSANSLKVHTSYTGGFFAGATLSNLIQKNNYSQTESSTWKGAVDVSWIPDPIIGLFFKYRHRDVDMDTPDTVTLEGLSNTLNYPVRQGISYDKDIFSVSARYRPLSRLSLVSTYEYSHIEKENVDQWEVLEDRTAIHRINLTARAKPLDKLKLKAIYEYKYYDDPVYNTDPDNSKQLRLTATYLPVAWINFYLDYQLTITERDNLLYLNNNPFVLLEGGERDGRRDRFLASLSCMFSPKATVTASWSYNRWDVEQDLAYGKWNMSGGGDLPFIDTGVPYSDEANSFSLGLHYLPWDDITVTADLTYTLSEGEYVPGDILADSPATVILYSDLEAAETIFSFGISKKLPKDWEIGFKFYTDIYDDKTDGLVDGELFISTFNLKRYF